MKEEYVWIKELSTEFIYYAQIVSVDPHYGDEITSDVITKVDCNFIIGDWKYFTFVGILDKLKEEPCICLLGPSSTLDHFGKACFDFDKLNVGRIKKGRCIICR